MELILGSNWQTSLDVKSNLDPTNTTGPNSESYKFQPLIKNPSPYITNCNSKSHLQIWHFYIWSQRCLLFFFYYQKVFNLLGNWRSLLGLFNPNGSNVFIWAHAQM